MKDLSTDYQMTFRASPSSKEAIEVLVSTLRARKSVSFRGRKVTREAFACALFLAVAEMPLDELVGWVEPYMRKLEAELGYVEGEDLPEEEESEPTPKKGGKMLRIRDITEETARRLKEAEAAKRKKKSAKATNGKDK